jgi:hypothetical protein
MFDLKKGYIGAFIAVPCLFSVILLSGCGTSAPVEPASTPTELPLTVWEFEKVCRQGRIAEATPYSRAQKRYHPLIMFQREGTETNSYYEMSNILVKLPEPWIVDYLGDATTIELVVCITRTSESFVKTCEFEDDEVPGKVRLLDLYDASYEVRVITATGAEELGKTILDARDDVCPMFHMFSEEKEDTFAYVPGGALQEFLTEYAQP